MSITPRFSTLSEWLLWQESLHPQTIDLGLTRVSEVWNALGGGKPAPLVITVGGTNGKGSSVALLESIYLHAGYRVGSFTSPHILRYNERIKINGVEAIDADLCAAFEQIDTARKHVSLSYFEFSALAALYLLKASALDIAILEVGLGGRLDASNIIDADIALVTSIGLDHQNWLGNSREEIAHEKAGIFRKACPAICGDPDPPQSLINNAKQMGAKLILLKQHFNYHISDRNWHWRYKTDGTEFQNLPFPGIPGHQMIQNAAAVLTVVHQLQSLLPVSLKLLKAAIEQLSVPGRFQRLAQTPEIIVDVAHNEDAVNALCKVLAEHPKPKRLHLIFGMLSDKNLKAAINLLKPYADSWYLAAPDSERAYSLSALMAETSEQNISAEIRGFDSIADAFQAARKNAGNRDLVLATGSFLTVAEVLAAYAKVGL